MKDYYCYILEKMDCFTSFAMTLFRGLAQINQRASLRGTKQSKKHIIKFYYLLQNLYWFYLRKFVHFASFAFKKSCSKMKQLLL